MLYIRPALERGETNRAIAAALGITPEALRAQIKREKRKGALPSTPSTIEVRADWLPADKLPARVERDPCFKCGTRADVGCVHSRMVA